MGRLSKEIIEHIRKNPPTYYLGGRGITMFEHIDAIELELKISKEDEQRALDAMNRLMDNVAQLTNEKREVEDKLCLSRNEIRRLRDELASVAESRDHYERGVKAYKEAAAHLSNQVNALTLEKARESKKVSLPKEVADEIHKIKVGYKGDWRYRVLQSIFECSDSAKNLRKLSINETLSALVDGYTVEKTKEDRLREGIEKTYHEWTDKAISEPHIDSRPDLFAMITDFVTKFNAEN